MMGEGKKVKRDGGEGIVSKKTHWVQTVLYRGVSGCCNWYVVTTRVEEMTVSPVCGNEASNSPAQISETGVEIWANGRVEWTKRDEVFSEVSGGKCVFGGGLGGGGRRKRANCKLKG
jgi:hypothetical protein